MSDCISSVKLIALSTILAFQFSTNLACLNIPGTTLDGSEKIYGGSLPAGHSLQKIVENHSPSSVLSTLQRERNRSEIERNATDDAYQQGLAEVGLDDELQLKAIYAILEGDTASAISQLEAIEKDHPGNYVTAANLGTAYELNGNLDSALKWIGEGIARNPDAHHGTEWLHMLILETKLTLEDNPTALDEERLIPLPNDLSSNSSIPFHGKAYSVEDLKHAIYHQLSERMVFVKPKDTVVADLLFTLAQLEAQTTVLESAIILLDLSDAYGFPDTALLESIRSEYQGVVRTRELKGIFKSPLLWCAMAILLLIIFRIFKWMKSRRGMTHGM